MKELKIEAPQGYEIDKENSTLECIKFKKKQEIKTWEDLCVAGIVMEGFIVSNTKNIVQRCTYTANHYYSNIHLTEKEAKSSRATSMISQLMPYYGGAITDEEWKGWCMRKFVIRRNGYGVQFVESACWFYFLAFRTAEQRDDFYKYNEKLVKDYLMID